jgi:hypothetical protein
MNKKTRDKLYPFIVSRDGECCQACKKKDIKLVIDHKDGNNVNNNPENLRLLCRACNYHKGREQPLALCVKCGGKINCDETNSCVYINRKKEPEFRKFIVDYLKNIGEGFHINVLINAGAEKIGISTVTAKRYMNKMLSREGELELFGDRFDAVRFKRKSIQ